MRKGRIFEEYYINFRKGSKSYDGDHVKIAFNYSKGLEMIYCLRGTPSMPKIDIRRDI